MHRRPWRDDTYYFLCIKRTACESLQSGHPDLESDMAKPAAARAVSNAHPQEARASNRARLIDAAIRCIRAHGISQTFVDDIAREAGLSRPTAYRAFGSRKALLESVAAHSANLFKERMKRKLRRHTTFADAITIGSTESLRIARRDKVFMAVLDALGDKGLERYLLDPAGPVFKYTKEAWADVFAKARAGGELRREVSDDEVVTLICGSNCFFLLRDDFSAPQQIAFLRKFLLPALLAGDTR